VDAGGSFALQETKFDDDTFEIADFSAIFKKQIHSKKAVSESQLLHVTFTL
jgi:hypothetical protein